MSATLLPRAVQLQPRPSARLLAWLLACGALAAQCAAANEIGDLAPPPTEVPAFLAHLPKHELKLDTLSGCGLIDSASIGPGITLADLRIGRDSLEQVGGKLERQGAPLNNELGYRGYREDLPIALAHGLPALAPFAAPAEVWLRFNSLRVLYRVSLVLEGASARAAAQAMLARDAPALAAACPADRHHCSVQHAGVGLALDAHEDRVLLSIASLALDTEARETEKLIDADIRRKRVGAARKD